MMRNKKRVAVLSCVIAAAVAAITACGGQPQGPAGSSGGESMSAETEAAKAAVNVDDTLSFDDAVVTEFNVKLDGNDLKITEYEDCYVLNPTNIAMIPNEDGIDQKVSIYVPENATKDSAIIFSVNNSGWIVNAYNGRTQIMPDMEYASDSDTDNIGALLSRGYIFVSHGARSRGDNPDPEKGYIGHSPATITDTKAVIRYLRKNADALPAGDPEKIVITGTSGGGALSTVICASGDSPDFYESLYEIGAAGISKDGDTYTSDISDAIFGTIAYCPINDLREADAAYEFTYANVRQRLVDDGLPVVNKETGETFQDPFTDTYTPEWMMDASYALADQYKEYVTSLGIPSVTGDNLMDVTLEELNESLAKASEEIGADQIINDLAKAEKREIGMVPDENGQMVLQESITDLVEMYNSNSEDWIGFMSVEDGVAKLLDQQALEDFFYFVARNQTLKVACAFSNKGLSETGLASVSGFNEDSLYGTTEYPYSAYEFYSWNNDAVEGNGCGLDDTGLTWDEFMETEEGQALDLQLQMSSPIPYLVGDRESTVSPNWYVRHGFRDRDTAFALQAVLFRALDNNDSVVDPNCEFAWIQPHSGDYDVQEAYAWLDGVLK